MTMASATLPLQLLCQLAALNSSSNFSNIAWASIQPPLQTIKPSSANLPQGYIAHSDLGVALKYYDDKLTWMAARQRCIAEGADLVVIDSDAKAERVFSQRAWKENLMHVGLLRMYDDTEWVNIRTGQNMQTISWASGEPTGPTDCVSMKENTSKLGNFGCVQLKDYMCEILISG